MSLFFRDVAQPGSALAWGARGRGFESRHPDYEGKEVKSFFAFFNVIVCEKC